MSDQTQHPQPPGRMTDEEFAREFPSRIYSAWEPLWREAERARASEQRLLAEREELVKALKAYGQHAPFCSRGLPSAGRPCNCGLMILAFPEGIPEWEEERRREHPEFAPWDRYSLLTRVRAHDGEGG